MHNVTFNPLFENFKISWPTNTELNNPNLRNHLDFYIPPARTSTAKRLPFTPSPPPGTDWTFPLQNPFGKSAYSTTSSQQPCSTTSPSQSSAAGWAAPIATSAPSTSTTSQDHLPAPQCHRSPVTLIRMKNIVFSCSCISFVI